MPRLLRAQKAARAADLQIAHGDAEAGVELRKLADGAQALFGDLAQLAPAPERQVRARAPVRAAHAPAQLVQLGKAHAVGVLDDEGIHVRNVDAGLDDGRADQDLRLARDHALHDRRELLLVHLAVRHIYDRAVEHLRDAQGSALDVFNAVVQVVHLPAALQLAAHGVAQHVPVVLHNEGLHRDAVLRRLFDGGHVADAGQGHVQRARDGRGREREHVDRAAHLLDVLLVRHAEALLLVDDEQAEVLERNILLQQLMRADHEIALAAAHVCQRLADLPLRAKAREHPDLDRETIKPLHGRLIVLLGEHGRRHQNGRLPPVEHALHHRAQGDLSLAVAHVAAQEAVHGHGLFHVGLDLIDAPELVVRLRISEMLFKLRLPRTVGREGVALRAAARGVECGELLGHAFCGRFGARFRARPLRAAHFGQLHGPIFARADVFAHKVELRRRDIERVRSGVADLDIVLHRTVDRHLHNARKAADAVIFVHDEVADGKVGVGVDLFAVRLFFVLCAPQTGRSDLRVREDGEPCIRKLDARRETARRDEALPRLRQRIRVLGRRGVDAVPVKKLAQNTRPAHIARQHDHAVAEVLIVRNIVRSGLAAAAVGGQLLCRQAHERAHLDGAAAELQTIGQYDGPGLDPAHHVGKRLIESFRARGHRAAAHEQGDVLAQLRGVFLRALGAACRLVNQHGRLRREIVQRRGKRVVHEAHIPVGRRKHAVIAELFPVGTQGLGELLCRVVVFFRGGASGELLQLFAQRGAAARIQWGQRLRRRQDAAAFQRLGAPLALRVKKAHGVHVIAPELHTHRLRIRRGEKVQNAAAARKLARPLHLCRAQIAAAQQRILGVLGRERRAVADLKGRLQQFFLRHGALQQTRDRAHHSRRRPGSERVKRAQALLLRLARDALDRVKRIVARRQQRHVLPQQGGEVFLKQLGRRLVRTHGQHRRIELRVHRRRQQRPRARRQTRNARRKPPALQQCREGGCFRIAEQLSGLREQEQNNTCFM